MKSNLKYLALATVAAVGLLGATQAPAATIIVSNAIERSTFWTKDNEYVLADIIVVRSNATLTVEGGTTVKGRADSENAGSDNPGSLIVARGSKIKCLGSEQAPVIFTDNGQFNSTDKTTRWGGIAICGRAYIARNTATGADPLRNAQLEGLATLGTNGLYGGSSALNADDDDDSGVLRYVSISNSGFGLAANNELNGIGLAGIGRETAVEHVEINNNLDDGIELWGGTVNIKYAAVINVGDDSFDIDEGYRGKLQFLFAVQGDAGTQVVGGGLADRGMELDGGNGPDNSQPFALWKAYNVTLIGKGQEGGDGVGGTQSSYTFKSANVPLYMRDNAGGQIRNSVFVDFGGWMAHVENEGGDGKTNVQTRFQTVFSDLPSATLSNSPANSYLYKTQTDGYQAEIAHCVFYQFGTMTAATAAGDLSANAASDGSTINQAVPSINVFDLSGTSTPGNITNSIAAPIVSWTRASGSSITGGVLNVIQINPLAANDATSSPITAPTDGFFTPVNYRGAFSTTNNWLLGWSKADADGLLVAVANPAAPTISIVVSNTAPEISVPTEAGIEYSLQSSYSMKHWSPITNFVGTGGTLVFVDDSGLTNGVQYRVVVP